MRRFNPATAARHPKGIIPPNSIMNKFCPVHQMYVYETLPMRDRDYEVLLGLYCLQYYKGRNVCAWCSQEEVNRQGYDHYVRQITEATRAVLAQEGRNWEEFERTVVYNEEL